MNNIKNMTVQEIQEADKYQEFVNNIKNKQNFSFIRYGDGEWALILKKNPTYKSIERKWGTSILETGKIMFDHIKQNHDYIIGVQPLALRTWPQEILDIIKDNKNVVNSDTFHKNSIKNNLDIFFEALKTRDVILVGPDYLKLLNMFHYLHVVTPEGHVWNHVETLKSLIKTNIKPNSVVLYSCSIAAKLIIHDLYLEHKDEITQIDMGSIFDPYVGVNSRSYHINIINRLGIPLLKTIHKK